MDVTNRVEQVRARIERAAARSARDPSEVTLIAVSKGFHASAVREAVGAGVTNFGENRVDELEAKARELAGVTWHFVGQLQRNKVRKVVGTASVVHSVDRASLAEELHARAAAAGTSLDVLIEVNLSGEQSKAGVDRGGLLALAEACLEKSALRLVGLMTMAPAGPPDAARPVFRALAQAAESVRRSLSYPGIRHLSMGMSQDYEVAIEEGATMVRIGEAIFGPRPRAVKG